MCLAADRITVEPAAAEALAALRPGDAAVIAAPSVAVPAGLVLERVGAASHAPGCACCLPRDALAEALNRLFIRRARGEVPFFRRVLAVAPAAAIAEALRDPLVAARFAASGEAAPRRGFRCESASA